MEKISVTDVWVPPISVARVLNKCNIDYIDRFSDLVCKTGNKRMKEYCVVLSASTATLHEVVMNYTGLASVQWKDELLTLDARWYLVETFYDMQTIARRMRFKDVKSFSSYFKRREGVTPSQYRQLHQIIRKNVSYTIEKI